MISIRRQNETKMFSNRRNENGFARVLLERLNIHRLDNSCIFSIPDLSETYSNNVKEQNDFHICLNAV